MNEPIVSTDRVSREALDAVNGKVKAENPYPADSEAGKFWQTEFDWMLKMRQKEAA